MFWLIIFFIQIEKKRVQYAHLNKKKQQQQEKIIFSFSYLKKKINFFVLIQFQQYIIIRVLK